MPEIIMSTSDNLQQFTAVGVSFEYIPHITCYRNYSAVRYANGTRSSANFLSADLCILDFDGSITLEAAKKMLADYKAIIVTTKSHQMGSKNGKKIEKRDRFRVIIPFDKTITNLKEYERIMKNITLEYNSDEACVDGARFFYKNSFQEQWISSGNNPIDTTFYAALPIKGHVRQSNTNLKLSDITLECDIDITSKKGQTLPASKWVQVIDADTTVTVHCPNPAHPDLHPSAFIAHATSDESKIIIFCHVCGALGSYPKTKNPLLNTKKGTIQCQQI